MAGTVHRPGSSNCDGINLNCRTGENDIAWTQELVLFAPEQEVMDQIRSIAEQYMQTCSYTIEFLDVIQTGRKTWVEIYIDSPNDIITMQSLTRIRNGIREELKEKL